MDQHASEQFLRRAGCLASRTRNLFFRDQVLLPSLPPPHRALLRSQAGPHAAAWLQAIPSDPHTSLTPETMQIALPRRLRLRKVIFQGKISNRRLPTRASHTRTCMPKPITAMCGPQPPRTRDPKRVLGQQAFHVSGYRQHDALQRAASGPQDGDTFMAFLWTTYTSSLPRAERARPWTQPPNPLPTIAVSGPTSARHG